MLETRKKGEEAQMGGKVRRDKGRDRPEVGKRNTFGTFMVGLAQIQHQCGPRPFGKWKLNILHISGIC